MKETFDKHRRDLYQIAFKQIKNEIYPDKNIHELSNDELNSINKSALNVQQGMWYKERIICLNEFYQLFNPSADIPNSIKEITNFGENYLYEIKQEYEQKNYKYFKINNQEKRLGINFCLPQKRIYHNLSFFHSVIISLVLLFEVAFDVLHVHQLILMLLFCSFTAFDQEPLKPSCLNKGDAGHGKSYALDVLRSLLIPGTYLDLKSFTEHAFDGAGQVFDMCVLILDDIMDSALSDKKGAKNETAQALKYFLSNNKLSTARCKMDDGNPSMIVSEAKTGMILIGNTNIDEDDILPPIVDRVLMTSVHPSLRSDRVPSEIKFKDINNPYIEEREKCQLYIRRTQYLMCLTLLLIHVGLIHPVNTTSVDIIRIKLQKLSLKENLKNANANRKRKAISQLLNIVVIFRAIVTLFDHPNSILLEKDWKPEHIFEIEKYLVATPDDLVFVMGLIEHQFESSVGKHFFNYISSFVENNVVKQVNYKVTFSHHDTNGYYFISNEESENLRPANVHILQTRSIYSSTIDLNSKLNKTCVFDLSGKKNYKLSTHMPIDDDGYCVFAIPQEYQKNDSNIRKTQNFSDYIKAKLSDKMNECEINYMINELLSKRVPTYICENYNTRKSTKEYVENQIQLTSLENWFSKHIEKTRYLQCKEEFDIHQLNKQDDTRLAFQWLDKLKKLEIELNKTMVDDEEWMNKITEKTNIENLLKEWISEKWYYPSNLNANNTNDQDIETCAAIQIYKDHFRVALYCIIDYTESSLKDIIKKSLENIGTVNERVLYPRKYEDHLPMILDTIDFISIKNDDNNQKNQNEPKLNQNGWYLPDFVKICRRFISTNYTIVNTNNSKPKAKIIKLDCDLIEYSYYEHLNNIGGTLNDYKMIKEESVPSNKLKITQTDRLLSCYQDLDEDTFSYPEDHLNNIYNNNDNNNNNNNQYDILSDRLNLYKELIISRETNLNEKEMAESWNEQLYYYENDDSNDNQVTPQKIIHRDERAKLFSMFRQQKRSITPNSAMNMQRHFSSISNNSLASSTSISSNVSPSNLSVTNNISRFSM